MRPTMVVPNPCLSWAPSLKLQMTRSPVVIKPAVAWAMTSPYGLPPCSIGSFVDPIVLIVAVDKVLMIEGFTVTMGLVTAALPPAPMHVSVKLTVPLPVGATVAFPLVAGLVGKALPIMLDAVAEQEVALVDVHASCTACPRLMVEALIGAVNITVGIAIGIGMDDP